MISEPEFSDRRFDYLAKVERQVDQIRICLEKVATASHDQPPSEKVALI